VTAPPTLAADSSLELSWNGEPRQKKEATEVGNVQQKQTTRHRTRAGVTLIAMGVLWAFARAMRPLPLPRRLPPTQREPGRRIPFDGPGNLRDLGGYQTTDGHTVRWGALYRSDHLGRLSARDLGHFRQLELAVLVDFRSNAERTEAPNRLPHDHRIRVIELPLFNDNATSVTSAELRARIARGDIAGIDAAALLIEANQRLVTEFTPVYRQFIAEVLAARGAPVLFHCTAGKDRTGFAAALLLRLLGVPEAAILADYLRSQTYSLAARRREMLLLRLLKGPQVTALVRDLLGVEAAYLQAAFTAVEQTYGSFAAYARDGLGLSAQDLAALRAALLEG
jgi:protein-tyrosine phosphatase